MTMFITLNILLTLVLWSLFSTMFTIPGDIPKYWVINNTIILIIIVGISYWRR